MWRVYPVEGYCDTRWLMGLWSTQTKVEGIVLKPAWHWGSNSIVNDSLGEPGLLSTWGSMDGDCIFSPHFVEGLLK